MAQLEVAWTVNHAVCGSNPGCAKLTKSIQHALNPNAGSFGSRPKLGGPVYHCVHVKDPPLPFAHWASVKGGGVRPGF